MRVEPGARASTRPTRRWPAALAAIGVVGAVVLTTTCVLVDRSNADAASSSRANAQRDALAVSSLTHVARSLEYASVMAGLGVVGLRDIGLHDYLTSVVGPLGGTLTLDTDGWTLALDNGWACLSWARRGTTREWRVDRGICAGAPIDMTPVVTTTAAEAALGRTESVEHAAVLAAFAAAASDPERGGDPLRALTESFAGHTKGLPFQWHATTIGVTVLTEASSACLRPVRHVLEVSLGACP